MRARLPSLTMAKWFSYGLWAWRGQVRHVAAWRWKPRLGILDFSRVPYFGALEAGDYLVCSQILHSAKHVGEIWSTVELKHHFVTLSRCKFFPVWKTFSNTATLVFVLLLTIATLQCCTEAFFFMFSLLGSRVFITDKYLDIVWMNLDTWFTPVSFFF